jgi:hypothetical protein
MGINAQASQVGTGRGAGSAVTMWIVVTIVVVSVAVAGIALALRNETATPSRQVVPSVTQRVPAVVVPAGDPATGAPGGYIMKSGDLCHQCK